MDRNGKIIGNNNDLYFDDINYYNKNLYLVRLNDKYSLLNKNGELIGNGNLWFTYINPFNDEYDSTVVCNMYGGIPKFSLITKNGVLVKGGNLWLDVISLSFEDGLALSMVNNKKYYIDTKGNFYDYETKQPIPSPIDNNKNESKKNN